MLNSCVKFVFLLIQLLVVQGAEYSYLGQYDGSSSWSKMYPPCAGQYQSPISLVSNYQTTRYANFNFKNYHVEPDKMTITNNGHTAEVSISTTKIPTISCGGLHGKSFKLKQLHFHWGSHDNQGSEHTINGKRYPLEMHLVHYDSSYNTIEDAVGDGSHAHPNLAVLGVLFEISPKDNHILTPLVDSLIRIRNAGKTTTVFPAFELSYFLPKDTTRFFRYYGSLTTPTCNEIVIWTVFSTPLKISSSQLAKFRKIFDSHGHSLMDNFRPIQNLNQRPCETVVTKGVC